MCVTTSSFFVYLLCAGKILLISSRIVCNCMWLLIMYFLLMNILLTSVWIFITLCCNKCLNTKTAAIISISRFLIFSCLSLACDLALVLASNSWFKGNNAPSVRSPVVDEKMMSPGHWFRSLLYGSLQFFGTDSRVAGRTPGLEKTYSTNFQRFLFQRRRTQGKQADRGSHWKWPLNGLEVVIAVLLACSQLEITG